MSAATPLDLADVCKTHRAPKITGYVARAEDAERRLKRGERQKRCRKCRRWFWADEMGAV